MRKCMLPYSETSIFGLFRLPAKKVGADAVERLQIPLNGHQLESAKMVRIAGLEPT